MNSLQTIGVIGIGTMGRGSAQIRAHAGLSVSMPDADEQRMAHSHDAVVGGLEQLVKKAKLSAAERDAALCLRAISDCGALHTAPQRQLSRRAQADRDGGDLQVAEEASRRSVAHLLGRNQELAQ